MRHVLLVICTALLTPIMAFSGMPGIFSIDVSQNVHESGQQVTKRPKKVLVFAPHPDDDVIGCGGSIAKHTKNGHEVSVVYMTSGDASGKMQNLNEIALKREEEALNSARVLGVKTLYFLRNPDGYLTNDFKSLSILIDLIRKEQPDIAYLPHHVDGHKDHIITHELVVKALRKASRSGFQLGQWHPWKVKITLCYEVWTPLQEVSYVEDISEFMEVKLQALRHHASQLRYTRYDNAVEGLNRYRGSMTRTGQYGEGFQVLKMSRDDLENLIQK